jgi:ligand-binding sensor domain-containing protein/serine phosphatase RsbU (regulator of sigma subunit)
MTRYLKPSVVLKIIFVSFVLRAQLFLSNTYGQFERFKTFDVTDGICHPFIYTINQDKNGFIWLGTGEGLCRFNGFEFESFSNLDSLSNEVVNTSFVDTFGDVWFGFNNGLILRWDGNRAIRYTLPENIVTSISSISQTPGDEIFVATLNKGCFIYSSDGQARPADENFNNKIISKALFTDDYLMLGTNNGLEIIPVRGDVFDFEHKIVPKQLSYVNIQAIKNTLWEDVYLIGTEDDGLSLLRLNNGSPTIIKIGQGTALSNQNVQDATLLPDKSLWICTYYGGLIKLADFKYNGTFSKLSVFSKKEGLATNYIKTIFSDREDNLWVGTYGNGICLLTEKAFTFMSFEDEIRDNNILSVASNDSIIWLGGENSLVEVFMSGKGKTKVFRKKDNLPTDKITALYNVGHYIWIGTDKNGIYKLNTISGKISQFFRTDNSLGNSVNALYAQQNMVYAATKDGVFIFDLDLNKQYHYNTSVGMPHNDIEFIYLDKDNRLLFATRINGIFEITDKGEIQEVFTIGEYELKFNSITQDINDNVWVSTYGQGVFLLTSDTVLNFTDQNGLKSTYCYSIATNDSNYIWVGHRLGLSRIDINSYAIKTFDLNIGIEGDCNHNAASMNNTGKIFFGTTDGLIIYDASKGNSVSVPPKTNILKLLINDVEYNLSDEITLPYGSYKLRIDYVGLNYNDPEGVRYQYILDGYDLDWSEITRLRHALYPRVEDGYYQFKLRSFSSDGQYNTEPVGFKLRIKPPFWKTWWFISLAVILIIVSVVFIIKYRERRQKEIQEYLEKSLDERTREVVEQKEEIEVKNRDITDSINYAQRIQNSILPPIKKLQQFFSGSFIFYQPRDIVSGDFYWFERVSEGKIIMVCADSTGHGVPGAFMSMIGTTLIKDICLSEKNNSPSAVLRELDNQLASTLNQNVDEAKSNDGMDMMICEVDINTKILRYASAMRPMILYKNEEQIYIKGSRSSIGGQYDIKEEKVFEDFEIQMGKGDLIYMFSDGYPDQFGGSMGKKFKMVRLKNLLKDIHKKPMEEQYEYVKSTFNLWKEDYEQVDDVLFMGIKL